MIKFLRRVYLRIKLFFRPFFERHLTCIFYGPRSSGKSLHQARTIVAIFNYLNNLYELYPKLPQAIVVSNQLLNNAYTKKYEGTRLFYWENIQQLKFCPRKNCWKNVYIQATIPKKKPKNYIPLPPVAKPHRMHDAYIIIDDCATIIPADRWQDLPVWFRKMWAQAAHNGIHCIGNVQDPVSIDINFRRYTDLAFKFTKLFGSPRPEEAKPPINFIYGIYVMRSIRAADLWKDGDMTEAQIAELKVAHPELYKAKWGFNWFLISKKITNIYNTLQHIPEYMPDTLEHIELKCQDPDCGHITVRHRVI
jgi:hypothetical protein